MTLAAALVLALVAAPAADARVSATVADGVVNPDGSATIPVTVRCPPQATVLEALVTLSQDDQAISGMGGLGAVPCRNGRKGVTTLVTVRPFDGAFHAGAAFASPYVLVQRKKSESTESGGTAAAITLR